MKLANNILGIDVSNSELTWVQETGNKLASFPKLVTNSESRELRQYEVYYRKDDNVGLEDKQLLEHDIETAGTHAFVAEIEAKDLNEVYMYMQGEIWSPRGEMRNHIISSGNNHTSMSIGDVIKNKQTGEFWQVAFIGFERVKKYLTESI